MPYTVYTTGIGWRNDKVTEDIAERRRIRWDDLLGRAEVHRQGRRASTTSARRSRWRCSAAGVTDVNTEDPELIDKALDRPEAADRRSQPEVNTTEYQTSPTGTTWLHQAWSGDMARRLLSTTCRRATPSAVRLLVGPERKGAVAATTCWPCLQDHQEPGARASVPELPARQQDVAFKNFVNFTGYQPPLKMIDPASVIAKGVIPENLRLDDRPRATSRPARCSARSPTRASRTWQNAWSTFKAGMRARAGCIHGWLWRGLRAAGRRLAHRSCSSCRPTPCSASRSARVDPIFSNAGAGLEPARLALRHRSRDALAGARPGQPYWTVFVRTFVYVAIALAGLPRDRLSGRLLPRAPRRAHEDAAAGAADPAVLGQLPDADAGVGRAAAPGRLRQPFLQLHLS